MRKLLIILFGILLILNSGFAQKDSVITKIRCDFKKWQPIIESKLNNCEEYYKYAWGEYYQFNKWYDKSVDIDSLTLSEKISLIEDDKLGYFIHSDFYSFSGDWYIAVDYYYNNSEQLYFIYWRMNTFHAEEPLTVEKRLYFNSKGDKIRELISVYKMNTKEKTEISFLDKDVRIKLFLRDMGFYQYWKNNGK